MLFKDIPGFEDVKERLLRLTQRDHVAHALMFSSKPGAPNLSMALAFSTYLNCENPGENDACGVCSSCVKALKYIHPDIHYVFPVSSTKKVKAEDAVSRNFLKEWREFLVQNPHGSATEWVTFYGGGERKPLIPVRQSRDIVSDLSMKSFEGKFKIMIIWLPEMMNRSSANALLKIIEEPPGKTLFMLVTDDESTIISTILSRTQIVSIRNWSPDELMLHFSGSNYPEKSIKNAANLSDGNIREMRSLLEDLEEDAHQWFRDWMRSCYGNDYAALNKRTDEFGKFNRSMRMAIFQYGLHVLREILVFNSQKDLHKTTDEENEFVKNFSKFFQIEMIEKMSSLLSDSIYHLDRNANAKIEFLSLSLKISMLLAEGRKSVGIAS